MTAAVRLMRPDDVDAARDVAVDALGGIPGDQDPEHLLARQRARVAHLLQTDPGGAWVAERAGAVAGVALALVREGIWGLSLLAVAEDARGLGLGRDLLGAALGHGDGARGHIVLSSEHPGAMRSYARAGLDLHPCVSAAGVVDGAAIPDAAARVEDSGAAGVPLADAIGRAVRGAGHGRDLPVVLRHGARLLTFEDRAFAVLRPPAEVALLAARDDEAAGVVLWGALAAAPRGATAQVGFLTAAQRWAVPVLLDAGLALSPDGPVFLRGDVGPFTPYVPSGAYL